MTTLSIVIPAYNEERFIGTLLQQIRAVDLESLGVRKEIIVVDDCSADRTSEIVAGFSEVRLQRQPVNGGKGKAVRQGISMATGQLLIIQDADLEYDPSDYLPMLRALLEGRGDVVYGSRYLGRGRHAQQSLTAYLGGRSLSLACGLKIVEVPIRYAPRSREEGKKIGLRDWFIALRTFIRYRNG